MLRNHPIRHAPRQHQNRVPGPLTNRCAPGSWVKENSLAGTRLASIFAEPMTDNLEKAIRYAFKAVESGRLDYDDSFVVLPRALSEVS